MKGYKNHILLLIAGLTSFVIQEPVLALSRAYSNHRFGATYQ